MDGAKRKCNRGIVLQARDLTLLGELADMRIADAPQLGIVAGFHSRTRVNTRLLALHRAGLLRRFFIGSGGGRKALYATSPKAAQLLHLPNRGPRRQTDATLVADFFVLHQLALNAVYCAVKFQRVPIPNIRFVQWLWFYEPLAQGLPLIPDGYVEWNTGSRIDAAFIEVDLGTEALSVWKDKAERYLELFRSGEFKRQFKQPEFRVLVLANSARRMNTIRAAVAKVTDRMFGFATLCAAQGDQFFGPVWLRPTNPEYRPLFVESK